MPISAPPEGWEKFAKGIPEQDAWRFVETYQRWFDFCMELMERSDLPLKDLHAEWALRVWTFPGDRNPYPATFLSMNVIPKGKRPMGIMEYEWHQVEAFLKHELIRVQILEDIIDRCNRLPSLEDWPSNVR